MEKSKKSSRPEKKAQSFLEWLAAKIEEDSIKEAQKQWDTLIADLRQLKAKHGLSWGIVGMAARHCSDETSKPPPEMILEVREAIYKEFREGSPFVGR